MGLFFHEDAIPQGPGRKKGFARYREILERDWFHFFLGGFVTLIGFLPFGVGMFFSVASTSLLVMLGAAVLGGILAGPVLYASYDMVFRALRDAPGDWWEDYKGAVRKNWRSALFPGIATCLFLGFSIFAAMLMFAWAEVFPGWISILYLGVSLTFNTMLLTTYWPQLVLFRQTAVQRLKNCLLFCARYFYHTLGAAALQVGFWVVMALFLPWSAFALPFLNVWFILYLANFLLYPDLDEAFQVEAELKKHFPEQTGEGKEI